MVGGSVSHSINDRTSVDISGVTDTKGNGAVMAGVSITM